MADAVVASAGTAWGLMHVSPDVLHAVTEASAGHAQSLPEIGNYIHSGLHAGGVSADGWLHRLNGYVGEQRAAEALRQAGHHVEFAPHPNQAGWDLRVDGHPVQIKEGFSASHHAQAALQHHPSIPIYTDPATAAHAHDGLVHGLHSLDPDAIAHATAHSAHALDAAFHPGLHVPWITVCCSFTRELRLIVDGRTELLRAAANVAVDGFGVAVGSCSGAKVGAGLGAPLGLPGMAAGALIGAIVGGLGGRIVAKAIRLAAFQRARRIFESRWEAARLTLRLESARSRTEVGAAQDWAGSQWGRIAENIRASFEVTRAHLLAGMTVRRGRVIARFPGYLDELERQLWEEEAQICPASPWRVCLFHPGRIGAGLARRQWFVRARSRLAAERQNFAAAQGTGQAAEAFERFLGSHAFRLPSLERDLDDLNRKRERSAEAIAFAWHQAEAAALAARRRVLKLFQRKINAIFDSVADRVNLENESVVEAEANLRREAGRVGIDLPPCSA